MSLTEALIFSFRAYVVDRSAYFHFFQGLDFPCLSSSFIPLGTPSPLLPFGQ